MNCGQTNQARYFTRSASDKTDDWPFWFVADRNLGSINVTAELVRRNYNPSHMGGCLTSRDTAEKLAETANKTVLL